MYSGARRGGEDTLVGEVCKMCGETRPPAHAHTLGVDRQRVGEGCVWNLLDNGDPVVANVAKWGGGWSPGWGR